MDKIIIVGGGIAGLYCSLELLERGYSTIIFEKSNRIGGRINTIHHDNNISYEAGAARWNNSHKLLDNLINYLDLAHKKTDIGNVEYYLPTHTKHMKIVKSRLPKLVNQLIHIGGTEKESTLRNKTLYQYLSHIFSDRDVIYFTNAFGYTSEIESLNAYDAIRLFKTSFTNKDTYYVLQGGLTQLINKLKNKIIKLGGKIKTQCDVVSISTHQSNYKISYINKDNTKKKKITDRIILALPKKNVLHFKILKPVHHLFNHVRGKSLLRIYAKYPVRNNTSWFSKLPKLTTNNLLKFIIPIDSSNGLIMISYSDARFAEYWMNSNRNGTLKEDIQHELSKCFPTISIPDPEKVYIHYWDEGVHFYITGVQSEKTYQSIINPLPNLYICNEAFSLNQAWIEGSLEMSKEVVKRISNTVGEYESISNNKGITLDDVAKHASLDDGWIVLYNKVYDITKWIPEHPGGSIILQGLGKDSTSLWESIHQSNKEYILHTILPKYQIGVVQSN